MNLIDSLKWRYATKKFDATKKVSEKDINYIKEAVQLTASSYGLQPYKVLEISNPEIRQELKPHSWNQSQITDASHLFVFCSFLSLSDKNVDDLVNLKSEIAKVEKDKYLSYGSFIKGKMAEKTETEISSWASNQTYIALGNALMACAELQIDCTPMEGFETEAYDQILTLSEKGLKASVVLAVGYRNEEDGAQHSKKVRKPILDIFVEV